jgi:acyl carrier protein
VNLLDDATTEDLKRASFLSPTGRCHTFESCGDGYARAEGGAVVILTRASASAVRGGVSASSPSSSSSSLRGCAVIAGTAVNQNRQQKPITAVDPVAQAAVVHAAHAAAGTHPSDTAAVECHGTGTKLGDPVEINALRETVGAGDPGFPCLLTAAKKQFGHLESAAGALGLLKALLIAERGVCPRGAPLRNVNAGVADAMRGSRLAFPTLGDAQTIGPLPAGRDGCRVVGVSSFGFSGSNAHVVVTSAVNLNPAEAEVVGDRARTRPAAAAAVFAPAAPAAPVTPKVAGPRLTGTASSPSSKGAAPRPPGTPCSAVECAAAVWSALDDVTPGLDRSQTANLFDLGVDSLACAELVLKLQDLFGRDVAFTHPLSIISSVLSLTTTVSNHVYTSSEPQVSHELNEADVPALRRVRHLGRRRHGRTDSR